MTQRKSMAFPRLSGRSARALLVAGLSFASLSVTEARAETADQYPSKQITIIVPFSAGGTTDILARMVGQRISEKFKKPVIVENRPGAGGNIGTAMVAKAPADGYTLVLGTIGTHAINSSLYKSMPYNAAKDFAPITRVAMVPNLLVVNKDLPIDSIPALIAYAKSHPGELTFGSSGYGTTLHLSGELFQMLAGVNIKHLPYKGSAPAITDLLGGHISMIFDNMPSAYPHVKQGKLKALAITSAARSNLLPNLLTVAEAGVPGFDVVSWFGLWAPANTPPAIIAKLNKEVVEIINAPDINAKIIEQGAIPNPETPEEFKKFIQIETEKWAKVVKQAGVQID